MSKTPCWKSDYALDTNAAPGYRRRCGDQRGRHNGSALPISHFSRSPSNLLNSMKHLGLKTSFMIHKLVLVSYWKRYKALFYMSIVGVVATRRILVSHVSCGVN